MIPRTPRRCGGEARASPHWVYDLSPDGKRFLINGLLQLLTPEPSTLVVNWVAELKKK